MFIFRRDTMPPMPGHVRNLSRIWEELLPLAVKKPHYKKDSYFSFPETEAHSFSYIFAPNVTQQELGLMLNIHKSSLNRTLLNMRSMGIIDGFTKKKCTILAPEKLKAIADGFLVI